MRKLCEENLHPMMESLTPAAKIVMSKDVSEVNKSDTVLAPIAGGSVNSALWYDGKPASLTILQHFEQTFDKVNHGIMDKNMKTLAKDFAQ